MEVEQVLALLALPVQKSTNADARGGVQGLVVQLRRARAMACLRLRKAAQGIAAAATTSVISPRQEKAETSRFSVYLLYWHKRTNTDAAGAQCADELT